MNVLMKNNMFRNGILASNCYNDKFTLSFPNKTVNVREFIFCDISPWEKQKLQLLHNNKHVLSFIEK